jgi:hypothetical protein
MSYCSTDNAHELAVYLNDGVCIERRLVDAWLLVAQQLTNANELVLAPFGLRHSTNRTSEPGKKAVTLILFLKH